MDAAIAWCNSNWWIVLLVVGALVKLLNVTTKHWSDYSPKLGKVCMYLVDCLDVFKPTPRPK